MHATGTASYVHAMVSYPEQAAVLDRRWFLTGWEMFIPKSTTTRISHVSRQTFDKNCALLQYVVALT
jgi:hypothetical protein